MHIAIISSSTRIGRQSHKVSLNLHQKISALTNISSEVIDLAHYSIPIFDEVLSRHPNPPQDLVTISQKLQKADAIIFVSPEYNGGVAPALKNLVDFLGKPEFSRKAIGVCSVSSGIMGGMRGALQMQQLVLAMFGYPVPQMLLVPTVQNKYGDDGKITDGEFEKKVDAFISDFTWFASAIVEKKSRG